MSLNRELVQVAAHACLLTLGFLPARARAACRASPRKAKSQKRAGREWCRVAGANLDDFPDAGKMIENPLILDVIPTPTRILDLSSHVVKRM